MIVEKGCLDAFNPGVAEFEGKFVLLEQVICPAFFVGIVSGSGHPVTEGDFTRELSAGQFLFRHQYSGTDCRHVYLWGVFLPILSCPDKELRARLEMIPDVVGSCTRDECPGINPYLRDLGPMQFDFDRMDIVGGEAFLEFSSCAGACFDWLKRKQFEYIVEMDLRKERSERRITRTKPLEWPDLASFAEWLSCQGRFPLVKKTYSQDKERIVTQPARVSSAFLYQNSD